MMALHVTFTTDVSILQLECYSKGPVVSLQQNSAKKTTKHYNCITGA